MVSQGSGDCVPHPLRSFLLSLFKTTPGSKQANKQKTLFRKTVEQNWPAVDTPLKEPTVSPANLCVLTHSQPGQGSAGF